MTRYLLDTTALIDFSKGRQPAQTEILSMIDAGDEIGVCAINVAEYYAGIPVGARELWDEFFASITYWHITQDIARRAGHLRHEYGQIGQTLSTTDTLVAAVAESNGAVIVTSNVKDYPLPNLSILSFLDPKAR